MGDLKDKTVAKVIELNRDDTWQGTTLNVSCGSAYRFDDKFKVINSKGEVDRKIDGKKLVKHATDFFPVNDLERDGSAQHSLMRIAGGVQKDEAPKCYNLYKSYLNKLSGDPILQGSIPNHLLPVKQLDLWSSLDPVLRSIQGVFRWYGCDVNRMMTAARLVITPSFDRFTFPKHGNKGTYLLPSNQLVPMVGTLWNGSDVCHVILVRPFQFDAYVKRFCPAGFIVVAMPFDEEGVGSARYWATVLARALRRETFVMLDDSLQEDTNEVILAVTNQVRNADKEKGDTSHDDHDNWSLSDGLSFLYAVFEGLPAEIQPVVGVMALRRYGGSCKENILAHIAFCQGFQLINVSSTFSKGVFFRRGYMNAEDILFGQTCLNSGLMSVQLDFVQFKDLTTTSNMVKTSGAHSPFGSASKPAPPSTPGARAAVNVSSSPNVSYPANSQLEATPDKNPQPQLFSTPDTNTSTPTAETGPSQGHTPDSATNAKQPDGNEDLIASIVSPTEKLKLSDNH